MVSFLGGSFRVMVRDGVMVSFLGAVHLGLGLGMGLWLVFIFGSFRVRVRVELWLFLFLFFGSFRVRDGVRFWLGPSTRLLHCVYMGEQSVSLLARLR